MDDKILPSSRDAAEPRRDSWDPVNDRPADVEREPTEDTEEWEQIIWPLRPMTCTSPPLSSGMVQWDVPDPATEMSFFVTDADMDDEVSGGSSSPELPQDQEESEEDWRIDLQLLNSVLQRTGSDSEVGFRLLLSLFLVATVARPFTDTCLSDRGGETSPKMENECGKSKSRILKRDTLKLLIL